MYEFLFLLGFVFLGASQWWLHRREMQAYHARALAEFRQMKLPATPMHGAFDGGEACIVEEKVEWARNEATFHYFLTVYATNASGEYFIFRSNYDRPILRAIRHEVARAILKSKYRAPEPQAGSE